MRFALLFACVSLGWSQTLTRPQFDVLVRGCLVGVEPRNVYPIARVESALNPLALSLNRPATLAKLAGLPPGRLYLKRQPKTPGEAARWVEQLRREGKTVSVGLMQVSVESSSLPASFLLDPCTNLKTGWSLFVGMYADSVRKYGPGPVALRMALGKYNGDVTGAYAARVLTNVR